MTPSNSQPAAPGLLVNAQDIGVRRGRRWIFRHVDIRVAPGEMVFLIGANGAGKSTCVKAVLGLVDITEGHVARTPGLEVGYVPQRLQVTPTLPLTLRRLMTLTGRFDADRIEAALAAVGLERMGDPPVTTLSGGEFQRLLLARALIHQPDLLVLDEPEQGVDATGTYVVDELIDGVRRDLGCGVLVISHDLRKALKAGDDLVVLVPHEYDDPPFGISGFKGMGED